MRRVLPLIALGAIACLTGCSFLSVLHSSEPPNAVIAAQPVQGRAPLRVEFDASGSSDDGTIAEHLWTFETGADEKSANGARAVHTFETSGIHTRA